MLRLKNVMDARGLKQVELAERAKVSPATISLLINKGQWPKSRKAAASLRRSIQEIFHTDGIFEEVGQPHGNAAAPDCTSNQSQEDDNMLLRKQTLSPQAKRQFNLVRDPFGDLNSSAEMWVSSDIRYVREHMFQTAKHGGFLAVVGESGAGKSTVRRDLEQRIHDNKLPIVIIQPYVLAAEDNDTKGKTLKSTHIAEALLAAVAPLERIRSSPEARFAQLHKALISSHNSGYRHCLVIEEAHSLPIPTLKHLKRIMELEIGYTKLVSVILIGQPELLVKLSERNAEVREVVQRCEVVKLTPVAAAELTDFIDHRLSSCNKKAGDVIDDSGIAALVDRLVSRDGSSQLYPLAIGNFIVAAMNLAARIGVPMVDADIINEVIS
mgnify:CR=1 FL=1|jgi:Type II secretory pathway, component ExeA (predicted ATPase)